MIVLVPAYEPDHRLVVLIRLLRASAPHLTVVVVDDGSGPAFGDLFDEVAAHGCTVLRHPENLGKGAALRTGFAHAVRHHPGADVVCADCDGQHTLVDVLRVAEQVAATRATVLGVRGFTGVVPLRSRVGNAVTGRLFALATGHRLRDTQTGLRGYPADRLPWLLRVPGERFEYELAVLLRTVRERRPVVEVPISTVYLEENTSSHVRPVLDSVRVSVPLLLFAASSLLAFAVDTAALLVVHALTGSLLVSVVAARGISSVTNFVTNRRVVFPRSDLPWRAAAVRYFALALALLGANYLLMAALTGTGLPLLAAKVVTEVVLFVSSYAVQHRLVFAAWRPTGTSGRSATPSASATPRRSATSSRSGGPGAGVLTAGPQTPPRAVSAGRATVEP